VGKVTDLTHHNFSYLGIDFFRQRDDRLRAATLQTVVLRRLNGTRFSLTLARRAN
jgi:hypothetical protein